MFSTLAFSQNQTVDREQSNIEKFSAKSGTLIEKQFVDVGNLKGVKVQLFIITDMLSNSKASGLRMEYVATGRYSSDSKIAVLDQDELDGLIKSINILKTKVFNTTRDSYTEIIFRSRSGFEAGGYYSDGKWKTFMKLERFDKDSYIFLQPEDFDALAELLQQAKQKLV
jgi:retron-type reverse transcriptase